MVPTCDVRLVRSKFPAYPPSQEAGSPWADERLLGVAGYMEMAGGGFAGCSFENGIYRLHDEAAGPQRCVLDR
jgi:hypothetical protein